MEFKTHNNGVAWSEINGTHLQGYVMANYADIVAVFGKPTVRDDYKCDAEWMIKFSDGTVATLYNYKNGKNYLGKEGLAKTKITEWNIGGHNERVVELVQGALSGLTAGAEADTMQDAFDCLLDAAKLALVNLKPTYPSDHLVIRKLQAAITKAGALCT